MSKHRDTCSECLEYEESLSGSLFFLRAATMDSGLSDDFTFRVARKARLVQRRDTVVYWSPAVWGAGVACLVVLAALQLASQSNEIRVFKPTTQDAMLRRGNSSTEPRLLLLKRAQAEPDYPAYGP